MHRRGDAERLLGDENPVPLAGMLKVRQNADVRDRQREADGGERQRHQRMQGAFDDVVEGQGDDEPPGAQQRGRHGDGFGDAGVILRPQAGADRHRVEDDRGAQARGPVDGELRAPQKTQDDDRRPHRQDDELLDGRVVPARHQPLVKIAVGEEGEDPQRPAHAVARPRRLPRFLGGRLQQPRRKTAAAGRSGAGRHVFTVGRSSAGQGDK